MGWQTLVLVGVLADSASLIIQKVLLADDQSDPLAYAVVFQLTTGALASLYVLARGFHIPDLRPIAPNLALSFTLYACGSLLVFKSLRLVEASSFTVLSTSGALWSIAAATAFLGERFSVRQAAGAASILGGVVLVTWKSRRIRLGRGELFALAAALAYGAAFVNDAFIVRSFDVPSYMVFSFIVPALGLWLLNPRCARRMRPLFAAGNFARMALFALFYLASAVALFLAYQRGRNAAQIAALSETSVILSVLLAAALLGERDNLPRKLLGASLGVVGVSLIKA